MKRFIAIAGCMILLAGCSKTPANRSAQEAAFSHHPPAATATAETPQVSSEAAAPQPTAVRELSREEAVEWIKSKLSDASLKESSVRYQDTDPDGNYIIAQSSSATTEIMEWYHVNPKTQEVTCEISPDECLAGSAVSEDTPALLNPEQQEAQDLARAFAEKNLGPRYVDGVTAVELDHEDNGNPVFHVYNPGSGHTETLDWLTVNLADGTVEAMFTKSARYSEKDFSISAKNATIPLKGWDNELNLAELLGKPLSQVTETLQNADTLTGSFVRTVEYPGLTLQLFSPKQDGKAFWIMNMKLTDSSYATAKGLHAGMPLAELIKVYPELAAEGADPSADPDNRAYELSDQETYTYARYDVKSGVIREIYIYHLIP
ncbi:hypothetical protein [Paenibacillus sp. NFR01]|uniref:hypothetical protein n=1 Tax=Paenibacillus sp. NFR01 TaxID=1566279 RepID=UPI0008B19606|nr:hypothetical protein [Paenibacillus sp. NFR01]SET96356.1 hypothetical protein SAMN03159358_2886 [Paenibacillus sp. NFR01]